MYGDEKYLGRVLPSTKLFPTRPRKGCSTYLNILAHKHIDYVAMWLFTWTKAKAQHLLICMLAYLSVHELIFLLMH